MPIIPPQIDFTIQTIKTNTESKLQSNRGYLGASEIGEQCARRLWYSLHGYPRKTIKAEQRLQELGKQLRKEF